MAQTGPQRRRRRVIAAQHAGGQVSDHLSLVVDNGHFHIGRARDSKANIRTVAELFDHGALDERNLRRGYGGAGGAAGVDACVAVESSESPAPL